MTIKKSDSTLKVGSDFFMCALVYFLRRLVYDA